MKRRKFIERLGAGIPTICISSSLIGATNAKGPFAKYPDINSIEEAKTKDGFIVLRLVFTGANPNEINSIKGSLKASGADIHKLKPFFFEAAEDEIYGKNRFNLHTSLEDEDILVVWLKDARADSSISIAGSSFSLQELMEKQDIEISRGNTHIMANFLFDKEIGQIDPKEVRIQEPSSDAFSIIVMADTQGGDPSDPANGVVTRMKIHNAFIEESVALANEQESNPLFNIVIGDIVDEQGQKANYDVMLAFFSKLKMPVLFSVGNHETKYKLKFGPGYNMEGFTNYFNAQKQQNGMDKLLYSFNLGQWHFVVWPDPLRSGFWETHPHYFDWLEEDLEKHKDTPTIFFHHVPLMPIGIDPLIDYVEGVTVKKKVLDILAKHGNVKYALSGHVHIPLKASVKTAVTYKGIKFVNLPAAGYRPRSFGEEDYYGGPTQGIALMHFKGKEAKLQYQNVTREIYTYAEKLPEFNEQEHMLWLKHKWELPSGPHLQNGDFSKGLSGWHRRYVYQEDENPSNGCKVVTSADTGEKSLFLFSKKRGYGAPGQDRWPQTINRISQAVSLKPGEIPQLELNFKIDPQYYIPNSFNGAFVWLEAFEKSYKRLNLVYSIGKIIQNIGGKYSDAHLIKPIHYDISASPDQWHQVKLNPFNDYKFEADMQDYKIDRLVVNLGVWTVNDGKEQKIGVLFDDLQLKKSPDPLFQTSLNGQPVVRKDEKGFWHGGIKHVAGEHHYLTQPE